MIFQLVLANKRDAVPIVRDYMIDDERAARERSRAIRAPHMVIS